MTSLLSMASREGEEGEVLVSSPWVPATVHVRRAQSCIRGGSEWTTGNSSLPRGWSNLNRLSKEVVNALCLKRRHFNNGLNNGF